MITLHFTDFTLSYNTSIELIVVQLTEPLYDAIDGEQCGEDPVCMYLLPRTRVVLNTNSGGAVYIPETVDPKTDDVRDPFNDDEKYFRVRADQFVSMEFIS
tara:strand:+ start:95 stop:397 length:303 start_codon:yes stop_codon:yes gene_type:complete